MRVFNNRILRIKEEAELKGARTYMALKTNNEKRQIQLAPSLLFVRWTEDALKAFKQDHFSDLMIYRRADSTDPAPIDEQEMRMFILVTSATEGRDVDLLGPDQKIYDFRPGEKVRVTEGPFKGAEGIIKRIKKDRKLIVQVSGVVVVAVSNIPGQFLERADEPAKATSKPANQRASKSGQQTSKPVKTK